MTEDDPISTEDKTETAAESTPAEPMEEIATQERMTNPAADVSSSPAEPASTSDKPAADADDKSSESQHPASSPPGDSQPLPVLTNTNRPSSVNSTHSGASVGNVLTTTTSRRGGRIRSRSPAISTNRPPGDFAENRSHSPKNPSSAAAAAAAAAKALSTGPDGRNTGGWGGPGRQDPRFYDQGNVYGGPQGQGWPGEGGDGRMYGQEGRHSQSIHRQPYDQGFGEGHQRSNRRHPNDYHGQYDGRGEFDGGRYGYDNTRGGRGGGAPPFDQRSPRMRQDFFNGPGGMAPVERNSPVPTTTDNAGFPVSYASPISKASGSKRLAETPSTVKRRGGTSRVIGTPTPIHVPRAADPPNPQFVSQSTASSVFRRSDDAEQAPNPSASGNAEDETPQRLLMSLRTPTASFEENKSVSKGAPPLSPEEPPKIQHAHQQSGNQPLVFEPQRSPRSQGTNLEMAPSFSLFNHSFDSLGEAANYLGVGMPPLDSGFQSHSFGAGPTGSGDNDNAAVPMLPSPSINQNSSFGQANLTQQILGGSASGGMLTFGMSPDNSFGNGPPSSDAQQRRRGNMMILADDGRAQSPTQVLGMYPSYSGGYGAQPPQAPFRPRGGTGAVQPLGAGSFGPSMSQSYTRSFDGMAPVAYSGPMAPLPTIEHPNGALSFYPFLRRNRAAFVKCTFLLPGLKAAILESPISETALSMDVAGADGKKSGKGSKQDPSMESAMGRSYLEPKPHDTAIAMRRITSSICAFGGTISGDRAASNGNGNAGASSIFRSKNGSEGHATVTPSSSSGTPPGNRQSSRARAKYDELLPTRYYENENRLSWEFEETPPVGNVGDDDDDDTGKKKSDGSGQGDEDFGGSESGSPSSPDAAKSGTDGKKPGSPDQPKMRYRCKLCGLPKQNHTCPYQQSLQRSIGVMVYPAVNAFTSHEPGMLAPALVEMNNFIGSGSESLSSPDTSPGRPSPGRRGGSRATTPARSGASNVTPDSKANSPGSRAGSTPTGTPKRPTPYRTPRSSKRKGRSGSMSHPNTPGSQLTSPAGSATRKRPHGQISEAGIDGSNDMLFVEGVELKPEQFKMVTPSTTRSGAYTYPTLPLPYAQRKRLSDNLFALSKEVPQLTDECAVVLREAREKDMWDLAVAELMTQVVIVIHCHETDTRMEGLRQYLLTLGIAC